MNPQIIITRLCSPPQLCGASQHLSAHCFGFTAHNFTVFVIVCPPVSLLQPDFSIPRSPHCYFPSVPQRSPDLLPPFTWWRHSSTHLFLLLSSALQLPDFPRPPAPLSATPLKYRSCSFVSLSVCLFCYVSSCVPVFPLLPVPTCQLPACLSAYLYLPVSHHFKLNQWTDPVYLLQSALRPYPCCPYSLDLTVLVHSHRSHQCCFEADKVSD